MLEYVSCFSPAKATIIKYHPHQPSSSLSLQDLLPSHGPTSSLHSSLKLERDLHARLLWLSCSCSPWSSSLLVSSLIIFNNLHCVSQPLPALCSPSIKFVILVSLLLSECTFYGGCPTDPWDRGENIKMFHYFNSPTPPPKSSTSSGSGPLPTPDLTADAPIWLLGFTLAQGC